MKKHAEAVASVFPSEFEAADHIVAIAERLDYLEGKRVAYAKRVEVYARQVGEGENNTSALASYFANLNETCAKIEATEESLRDALRSYKLLKAYVAARGE